MFRLFLCTALCGTATIVAHAEDQNNSVATAYARLCNGLQEELQILSAISDTATAKAAVKPLSNTLTLLAQRVEGVSDKELWSYIDNTQDNKLPLIELVQKLTVQFQRIEKAKFFGSHELRETMLPQLRPNPDKTRD